MTHKQKAAKDRDRFFSGFYSKQKTLEDINMFNTEISGEKRALLKTKEIKVATFQTSH